MVSKTKIIILAPCIAVLSYFLLSFIGLEDKPAITAAITLLTIIWWVTEALPIPATSIVPFALFPLFGILDDKAVASALGSHVILLLMGAFMLSKAIEKSNTHQRLALYMVRLAGTSSAKRLVMGFMLASAVLSMWISNTATTLIMLPIAIAILSHTDNPRLTTALILGIAYAASVGGIGTPIGTPPNAIFMAIYEEYTGSEFGFYEWMKLGVPVVLVVIPIVALWLTRNVKLENEIVLPQLGQWREEEKRTLYVFGFAAVAWITRTQPFGGWSDWFNVPMAGDSTVALFAVVLMFLIPNGKGDKLLDWQSAVDIPWGMLLLFAGGIAIAKAFGASGLSELLGQWLTSLANLPALLMILTICLTVTYLTEITSNTATATLLMPILAAAAISAGLEPSVFMIPAAMVASCAFMLPVATAPNAIAYATGKVTIQRMVKEGAVLSFVVSCIVGLLCYLLLLK
ncbi:SLC13 family permease [Thalassotalea marina]|uniref:Transporter n=1 Tax=Thalassotalea marina TaxID=1673741 RepID=A0A919EMA2_9GAMM|nr:SLC13 family permease [Thalassotalea marina]GHF97688.1 transporter [Thalassotalea marina]